MTRQTQEGGFTIVEVMVALVILVIGVLGLISASGSVNRMLSEGRWQTEGVQAASARLERLRQLAKSTSPGCTASGFANGTATTGNVTEAWTITASGTRRTISASATYRLKRGLRTVTLTTTLSC